MMSSPIEVRSGHHTIFIESGAAMVQQHHMHMHMHMSDRLAHRFL